VLLLLLLLLLLLTLPQSGEGTSKAAPGGRPAAAARVATSGMAWVRASRFFVLNPDATRTFRRWQREKTSIAKDKFQPREPK
jgi:hypothetical protein